MTNDSLAQALDLEAFKQNQNEAMNILEECSMRMDLIQSFALRVALSIDERDIPKERTISMGIAIKRIFLDIVSKIERAQQLVDMDLREICEGVRGVMFCIDETVSAMTLAKTHTASIFFMVHDISDPLKADIDSAANEIFDSKNRIIDAYAANGLAQQLEKAV